VLGKKKLTDTELRRQRSQGCKRRRVEDGQMELEKKGNSGNFDKRATKIKWSGLSS
jgi:hypothetical protein